MALYGIGDIHGCRGTLDALLDRIAPTSDDHIVFVGDYVDRGPDSRGVIERLMEMREAASVGTGPSCTFLRGNHDQMLLDWVDARPGAYELWRANGGLRTLTSYPDTRIPPDHFDFLRETELAVVVDGVAFVHAGFDPSRPIAEQVDDPDPEILLWTRDHLRADRSAWEMPVVCGHTPVSPAINEEHLIAIDTGAVYFHRFELGRLTAVKLPEREFIAVPYQQ